MLSSNKKINKKSGGKNMPVGIACDHGGFLLKQKIKIILEAGRYKYIDYGTSTGESCDYPKFGIKLIMAILNKKINRGLLICRSGIGFSILANRFKGIRAALCYNAKAAKRSRQHNDSNVLILGADYVKAKDIKKILQAWLNAEFEGGRHQRRLKQIEKYSYKH